MEKLDSIRREFREAFDVAIDKAFEAGRKEGRQEALDEFRGKMLSILNGEDTHLTVLSDTEGPEEASNERASPGSVKPTIEKMLIDAPMGLTTAEIVTRGNFKHNTVRGTLWTLGKEGFAQNHHGRWIALKGRSVGPFGESPPNEPALVE